MIEWLRGRWSRRRGGEADAGRDPAALDGPPPVPGPGRGPYDLADAPNDGVARLDLGSLLVPVLDGIAYSLRADGDPHRLRSVVAEAGASTLELRAFAAPRSGGLWEQTRRRLLTGGLPPGSGGPPTVVTGRYGPEVSAGALSSAPVRVVGVDGPRWMLRATITGPAAADFAGGLFDDVLLHTIVIRGDYAMPVGALLALRRPTDNDPPGFEDDGPGRPATPDDVFGRVRPTGTASADPRRVSFGVIGPPPGGLSRNLTTWG